jgi:hypothetical protein
MCLCSEAGKTTGNRGKGGGGADKSKPKNMAMNIAHIKKYCICGCMFVTVCYSFGKLIIMTFRLRDQTQFIHKANVSESVPGMWLLH